MADTSKEEVELHIQRCWLTDPEPDRTETILRALSAERDALQVKLTRSRRLRRLRVPRLAYDGAVFRVRELEAENEALRAQVAKAQGMVAELLARIDNEFENQNPGELTMHTYGQTPDWYVEAAAFSCGVAPGVSETGEAE